MKNIVENINNKNYDAAGDALIEQFHVILERKMCEMKKMVSAKMEQNSHEERMRRLRMDVLEGNAEEPKLTQSTEQQVSEEEDPHEKRLAPISADGSASPDRLKKLDTMATSKPMPALPTSSADKQSAATLEEARVNIIKARIRGGVVQRRQRVSNVPGMTIRGGQLVRMSASERRARKLGAKKAARKTKTKQTQILRKRKMSLMKRQRLGI